MRLSISASVLATAAFLLSTVQAQDTPATTAPAAPVAGSTVNILYSNDGNGEVASEDVPFDTCYPSEAAFGKYSYLTFAPKNATINFFTDSNCHDFTFGLDGYYGGYPGPARSFKWVGWSEDTLGEFFAKTPLPAQGGANPTLPQEPAGGVNPGQGHGVPATPDQKQNPEGEKQEDSNASSSSTFFGGVVGSMVVLSIGGVIFWKTAGKKMTQDKGKGVLPYNRVGGGGGRDGDILLNQTSRGQNSFEIGDEEDEEDEEDRRQTRHGRQERYRDDDHA